MIKLFFSSLAIAVTFFATIMINASASSASEDVWVEGTRHEPYVFQFTVKTEKSQAADFATPEKLAELWQRLVENDPKIKKILEEIYFDRGCKPDTTYLGENNASLDFCGKLKDFSETSPTLWSYIRGGWAEADAHYKTFLTFTSAGSAGLTTITLTIANSIAVMAKGEINENGEYEFEVAISFTSLEIYAPNDIAKVQKTITLN